MSEDRYWPHTGREGCLWAALLGLLLLVAWVALLLGGWWTIS